MPLQVKCPNSACGSVAAIDDKLVGANTRCAACGTTFHVTAPATVAPRPAPSTILPVAAAKETLDGGASPATSAKAPAASGSAQRIGRFEIRARLGAGAFGVVYRAFDPSLQREIALKVLHPEMLNHPDRVVRFQREARSAAQLRHANIVPVFDIGQDGGQYYIASAYIPGQTLHDALDDQPMPFQRAARIVRDLANAVGYAHQQGVVHRDLKPANILLDEKDAPQLVDFGLSARQETEPQEKANRLTRLGAVLGTPAYMAPEQASGQTGEVQPAADQYSLGIILYELLCGRPPFEGPPALVIYNVLHKEPATPRSLNASVPRELERICLKAMARRPEDRYADCQVLADALRRWLENNAKPVRAIRKEAIAVLAPRKDTKAVLVLKKDRKEPRNAWLTWIVLATAACFLAAVLAVLGGGVWWMTHKKQTTEQPLAQEKEKRGALEGQTAQEPKKPDPQSEPKKPDPQPETRKPDPALSLVQLRAFPEVTMQAGDAKRLPLRVKRNGYDGPLTVRVTNVPASLLAQAVIPAGEDKTELVLMVSHDAKAEALLPVVSIFKEKDDRPEQSLSWKLNITESASRPNLSQMSVTLRDNLDGPIRGWRISDKKEVEWDLKYLPGRYSARLVAGRWACLPLPPLPGPFTDGAIEMVGRVVGTPKGYWGFGVSPTDQKASKGEFNITLDSDSQARLVLRDNPEPPRGVRIPPFKNAVIKPNGEFNTLLLVVHGQKVQVFVNGTAVSEPVEMKDAFSPGNVFMQMGASENKDVRVEIKRFTVWIPKDGGKLPGDPPAQEKTELPKTLSVDLGGGMKMEFVLIPKGKFLMGSPPGETDRNPVENRFDAEKQHEVEITKPFYMAKYVVTQEQYQALMKDNPSYFQAGKAGANKVQGLDTKQFPVDTVSWNDAQELCKKMRDNDKQGRQLRLPTEAEWEYACRAGTTTPFSFGSVLNGKQANCSGNFPYGTTDRGPSKGRTTKVGEYGENLWGLCDMHGNVSQWCEDYYGPYNDDLKSSDPPRSFKYSEERRILRGGSWNFVAKICRAAFRINESPGRRNHGASGFRVCVRLD